MPLIMNGSIELFGPGIHIDGEDVRKLFVPSSACDADKKLLCPRDFRHYQCAQIGRNPMIPKGYILPLENQRQLNKTMHLFLQNKGGCGKTFTASLFSQFIKSLCPSLPLRCWDLEQSKTKSFSDFRSLNVRSIQATDSNLNLQRSRFDVIFNPIQDFLVNSEPPEPDGVDVIDPGASSYNDILAYLKEIDIGALMAESGWRFIIHSIIAGDVLDACLEGYDNLRTVLPTGYESIIWLNEYRHEASRALSSPIAAKWGHEFADRLLLLPQINDSEAQLFLFIRDHHLLFEELAEYAQLMTEQKAAGDLPPGVPLLSYLEIRRIRNYLYGTTSGKTGVYETLVDFDWAPHPLNI